MFSKRDLENVIAICEQDEDAPAQAGRLKERCERALAYRDCEIHITEEDKRFLSQYYDEDMDPEAKETLDKVLGGGKSDVLGKKGLDLEAGPLKRRVRDGGRPCI